MKRLLAFIALVLAVLSTQSPTAQTQAPGPEYVPGEVLVEYLPDASAGQQTEARSWVNAVRRELLRRNRAGGPRNRRGDLELARVPGRSVEQALAILRSHPAVRFAEPNWVYRKATTSNDPRYTNGDLWGMLGDLTTGHTNAFGSQAGEAWEAGHTGNASVAVGILDGGVQIDHPDLAANIWTNPVEAAGVPGFDDDDNGYIDDIHGWDFFNNDDSVFDDPDDDDHGTHVAGTIGAVGGNGAGVAGVNWHVTLIPAKFIGPDGGSTFDAVKALDYIADLKTRHHLNIVATNNSYGGGMYSQALLDAIVRGAKANILFVAGAGNSTSDNDASPFYPAGYDTTARAGYDAVIAVAAITSTGAIASFSNYGKTTVDLGAPGHFILSTLPGSTYTWYSGTSMAAPHVTGAAALYTSLLPSVSARRIREVILASATATPTASLVGMTVTAGRLNIGEFAGLDPAAPSAPVNLAASPASSDQINLTWADTSMTEDGFQIERCQGPGCTAFATVAYVDEDVVAFSDTGLIPATLYRYRVKAYNRGGASAAAQADVDVTVPGDMKGDGFIRDDEAKYRFAFDAREDASGSERAHLSVRIDGDGRKKGRQRDDRFESRSVDYLGFGDDPTLRPGRRPLPQIDTVLFRGAGAWNGEGGYRYEVLAQDAGEPGRHRESIRVIITNTDGAVVASFAGELDGGNIRSSRIAHR